MSDMRRLAALFFQFRNEWLTSHCGYEDSNLLDMSYRSHYEILETACNRFTVRDYDDEKGDKCGLMI